MLLLLLVFTFNSNSQALNSFSKDKEKPTRLQSHILIHQDKVSLATLRSALIKNSTIAIQLEKGEVLQDAFLKEFLKHKTKLVIITETFIDSLSIKYPNFTQIKPENIEFLNLDSKQFPKGEFPSFKSNQEFGSVTVKDFEVIPDSLFLKLWQYSGKLPNFIYSNQEDLTLVNGIVNQLNQTKKITGKISLGKQLLENVTFKDFKNKTTSGYFCFPVDISKPLPVLIPYKVGYHFSPDIIYITPENLNNLKEFKAFKLDADFGLIDYFDFDKTINNRIRKNDLEIISNNVKVVKDKKFGKVGLFENRAYIDAGLESRFSLQSSFTISAWIKPTELTRDNSILGKGDNFVLKLRNGYLTFTMAGVKDYISKTSSIPLNEWTFITLIHSKMNNNLLFYVNGELTDNVQLIADYNISNFNLLIGSNLWEEFFVGAIGEIKIWERELNINEVLFQFNKPKNTSFKSKSILYLAGGLFLCVFCLFLFFRIRKKGSKLQGNNRITERKKANVFIDHQDYIEKIYCFGELQIINNKGFDIATKLSPKLKSLFILIFLHSNKKEKGISSKKLTEILWPGMTSKRAKNTRGTNIQNLKALLALSSEIQLVFEAKKWQIRYTNNCFSDYYIVFNYFENSSINYPSKIVLDSEFLKIIKLLKRGRFLVNTNDVWLDPFVEKFSNQLIEKNIAFIDELEVEQHADLLFDMAEVINIYDDLNEKALQLKLQVLRFQGKLSLARNVYENFIKLYKNVYKDDYKITFEELISK